MENNPKRATEVSKEAVNPEAGGAGMSWCSAQAVEESKI